MTQAAAETSSQSSPDVNEQLFKAVKDNPKAISDLIAKGASPLVTKVIGTETETPLTYAIRLKHIAAIQAILATDAGKQSVRFVPDESRNETPLWTAVRVDSPAAVEELLKIPETLETFAIQDTRAVKSSGKTPLFLAAREGRLEMLRTFLKIEQARKTIDTPDKEGNTPLYIAAQSQHHRAEEICKLLLQNGADYQKAKQCAKDNPKAKERLSKIKNSINRSKDSKAPALPSLTSIPIFGDSTQPLFQAIIDDKPDFARDLIAAGASLTAKNLQQETPVISAVLLKRVEVLKVLLKTEDGAKYDADRENCEGRQSVKIIGSHFTQTPLGIAAYQGDLASANELLKTRQGLETLAVRDPRKGRTPLFLATQNNQLEMLRVILTTKEGRATVNTASNDRSTPLYLVAKLGKENYLEMGCLLLASGADLVDAFRLAKNDELIESRLIMIRNEQQSLSDAKKAPRRFLPGKGQHQLTLTPHEFNPTSQLFDAIAYNRVNLIPQLIQQGANLKKGNSRDETPLIFTIVERRIQALIALLATPQGQDSVRVMDRRFRQTPIWWAVQSNYEAAVVLLMRTPQGPKIVKVSDSQTGLTPLALAVREGYIESVRAILNTSEGRKRPSLVNFVTPEGFTLLCVAAKKYSEIPILQHKYLAIIKELLRKGADMEAAKKIAGEKGESAMLASLEQIEALLLKTGSTPPLAPAKSEDKTISSLITRPQRDIYSYPPEIYPHSEEDGAITIADLHGNVLKPIYILISEGVITLSKEIYEKILAPLYQKAERRGVFLSSYYNWPTNKTLWEGQEHPPLSEEDFNVFKTEVLAKIQLTGYKPTIRLLGDDVCDRGGHDGLMLYARERLKNLGLVVEVIKSNHLLDFLRVWERSCKLGMPGNFTSSIVETEISIPQTVSLRALSESIELGVISPAEVSRLLREVYFPQLKFLSYGLSPLQNEIIYYTHAMSDIPLIYEAALEMRVKADIGSAVGIAKTIERMNRRLAAHLAAGTVTELIKPGSALYKIINNRDVETLATFDEAFPIPCKGVHGHCGPGQSAGSARLLCLDTTFGQKYYIDSSCEPAETLLLASKETYLSPSQISEMEKEDGLAPMEHSSSSSSSSSSAMPLAVTLQSSATKMKVDGLISKKRSREEEDDEEEPTKPTESSSSSAADSSPVPSTGQNGSHKIRKKSPMPGPMGFFTSPSLCPFTPAGDPLSSTASSVVSSSSSSSSSSSMTG